MNHEVRPPAARALSLRPLKELRENRPFLLGALTLLLSLLDLPGHLIDTNMVVLCDLNDTAKFSIVDCCGCSALITAVSSDTNIVTVTPGGPIDAEKLTFTVTSRTAENATALITIRYIGEDVGTDGPCQEMATQTVEVQVKKRSFSTGETTVKATLPKDPVDSSTGELFRYEPADIRLGGRPPIAFERYYASHLERDGLVPPVMGRNWSHLFQWQLTAYGNRVLVISPTGELILFEDSKEGLEDGEWILLNDREIRYQLAGQRFGAAFTVWDPQTERFYVFDNSFVDGVPSRLSRIEDRKGNRLTISSSLGRITSVSDGLGRTLQFTYTAGLLTAVSDGTRQINFSFTGQNLTAVTDARGGVWTYTYDTSHAIDGLVTSLTTPRGHQRFQAVWDSEGRVASQTTGAGDQTDLLYQGNTTQGAQPGEQATAHRFDANGRLETATDEAGAVTRYEYDADGRRQRIINANGDSASVAYHPTSGLPTQFIDFDQAATHLTYQARTHSSGIVLQDLVQVEHPDGSSDRFTHDTRGNLISTTNRVGETYAATYNARGEALTVTIPTGDVYTSTYHPDGSLATFTDPAGLTQTYAYDAFRRRASVTYADGSSIRYAYDANDNLTEVTDREGRVSRFTYDDTNNVASAITPLGEVTTFEYDGFERLTAAIAPHGGRLSRTYDASGLVNSMTDMNNHTWRIEYDERGAPVGILDPLGNRWTRRYDREGRVLSQTDPLGNTIEYDTDANGLLTAVTSALGHRTQWTYGTARDLRRITGPDGNSWDFRFRANQQAESISGGNGMITTSWGHGPLERIERITDPNGNDWTRTHSSQGALTKVMDPLGRAMTFAADPLNRTETVTFPGGLGTATTRFNREWQLIQRAYSDGSTLDFQYNANGDLVSGTGFSYEFDSLRQLASSNGIAVTRDTQGNVITLRYAEGKEVSYEFNGLNRPTRVTDWLGGETSLQWDAKGQLTLMQRPSGVATEWTYDADGRLTGILESKENEVLSRMTLTRNSRGYLASAFREVPLPLNPLLIASQTFTYDAASQRSDAAHDALGRVVAKNGQTFQWDLAGRLTRISRDGGNVDFTYDALGMPVTRSAQGLTRNWVWNYATPLPTLTIEREGASDQRYHVYLPGGALLYSIDAALGTRSFYHCDEMGNVIFTTDETGAVANRYAFDPYGQVLAADEVHPNLFVYQGQSGIIRETDELFFMRARWYDAASGRFLSRDPSNQSLSPLETMPYGYARQNPLLYVDPRGTNVEVIAGGIHTDIKVDVWCGNRIIGTLTAGFFPKCVARRNPTATAGSAALTIGADSAIKGNFTYGNKTAQPPATGNSAGNVFVQGFKPADERLAKQILKWLGQDVDGKTAGEILKELYPLPKGVKSKRFSYIVDASNTFGGYRIFTQVCNDFTDEALDVYYGYNWYLGSFNLGSTLIDQVGDFEEIRADGHPLGASLYYDLVPALFGGG